VGLNETRKLRVLLFLIMLADCYVILLWNVLLIYELWCLKEIPVR